jgi:hypothetical protein
MNSRSLLWSSQKLIHTLNPSNTNRIYHMLSHSHYHSLLARSDINSLIASKWMPQINFHMAFHQSPNSNKEEKSVPRLFIIQNPITWLTNKLDFAMLRSSWDPQFDEAEFRRGTKQVCQEHNLVIIFMIIRTGAWFFGVTE